MADFGTKLPRSFLGLTDTESSYSGKATFFPQVDAFESELNFFDLFGSVNSWTAKQTFSDIQFEGINIDTQAANGDITKNFSSGAGGILTYIFTNSGAGTTILTVEDGFRVQAFNSAGFVKNSVNGLFSGGNSIDIGDDTNLAVSSPITLTGDTIGFDFSTNNTWTGTNLFDSADVTFRSSVTGNPTIVYDESAHTWTHNINVNGANKHFQITGTETTNPAGSPNYFDINITRLWTGAEGVNNVMSVLVTDDRTISSGTVISNLFKFQYDKTSTGGQTSGLTFTNGFNVEINDIAGVYSAVNPSYFMFALEGNIDPDWNDAGSRGSTWTGIDCVTTQAGYNEGAGTTNATTALIDYRSSYALMFPSIAGFGPDTRTLYGYRFRPSQTVGTGATMTAYGFHYLPNFSASGGTLNSFAIFIESDDIVLDADDSAIQFGEGNDAEILHDGTNWDFRILQATTSVIWNEDGLDTDFRIEGDNDANLFFADAGNDRIGIGTATPAVELDVDGSIHVRSQGDIRWGDSDNSNFVAFQSAATVASDVTWTLPDADGVADGAYIVTNGSAVLRWVEPASASVTVTVTSSNFQTEFNVFDEDNYSAFASTANLTAENVTFTSTDGIFDVTLAGKYNVECMFVANSAGIQDILLIVKVNTVDVYNHLFRCHSGVDPAIYPVTLILDLAAGDNITFHMDAQSATNLTARGGTTANIFKIAT